MTMKVERIGNNPVFSLALSITRERLRREILAHSNTSNETDSDYNYEQENDFSFSNKSITLEEEILAIQKLLPRQVEITGLEILEANASNSGAHPVHDFSDESSYDSFAADSIALAADRIEFSKQEQSNRKEVESNRKSIRQSASDLSCYSGSLSERAQRGLSSERYLSDSMTMTDSQKSETYANIMMDVSKNSNNEMKKLLPVLTRRLSVYSDHSCESDESEPTTAIPFTIRVAGTISKESDYYQVRPRRLRSLSNASIIGNDSLIVANGFNLDDMDSSKMDASDYANDSLDMMLKSKTIPLNNHTPLMKGARSRADSSFSVFSTPSLTSSLNPLHLKRQLSSDTFESFSHSLNLSPSAINRGGGGRAA